MNVRSLLLPVLLLLCTLTHAQQPSAVPEDARRYYVQGNTRFKEAQSADDYKQAAALYQQALKLAPDFGNAWYNLSKTQEKLQQYDDAITSLKHFLTDSPNDPEARTAQDHIYELEIKRDAPAKSVSDQKRAEPENTTAPVQEPAKSQYTCTNYDNGLRSSTVVIDREHSSATVSDPDSTTTTHTAEFRPDNTVYWIRNVKQGEVYGSVTFTLNLGRKTLHTFMEVHAQGQTQTSEMLFSCNGPLAVGR